jgi:hypothetical protein
MRTLSASELLDVWERASREHPVDRALTLLSACCDLERQELANLPLGRRDAYLLEMYERLFGPALDAFAQCPKCGERLEYRMSTRDLILPPGNDAALVVEIQNRSLQLRLPNSLDLHAVSQSADPASAQKMLLQRCVTGVQSGDEFQLDSLPESTLEKIGESLAQADPQAEMLIDLSCCACSHGWQVILDIERFLWVKLSALARRLLREVDSLARAYGWREHEILALSAVRRQAYLEMAVS